MCSDVAPPPARAEFGAGILIVDDERLVRWSLKERLQRDSHMIVEASTGNRAIEAMDRNIDLILLDYRLPDMDGMEVLARIREHDPDVPVIMMTAHSSVEHAVNALKAGAYHYIGKPFELDSVAILVQRTLENTRMRRTLRELQARSAEDSAIIGESGIMQKVKRLIPRIAASPASTVLITGESGTGKDLAAQAIHALSDRRGEAFVNITCSALPATLLESELFGHERGAFTDAKVRKDGLLQQAHGGTVFLDEIGEMEAPLQAKLLRFLEDKAFRRVGGAEEIRADVRVIAATNVDLKQAVAKCKFREDLYYRLAVMAVHLPPLRERGSDIDLIATYLVDRFNREFRKDVRDIDPRALRLLLSHPWPGNVRELRNAIERAVLLAEENTLKAKDFGFLRENTIDETAVRLPAGGVDIREIERSLVEQALERTDGNQTRAASLLGMNRDQIRYRMQQYRLLRKEAVRE